DISESDTFKVLTNTALEFASAVIKIVDNLRPLLPILTIVGASKLITTAPTFLKGFKNEITKPAFNSGGYVPGQGNQDTVEALLTPGEFVLNKKAVKAIGIRNLQEMNKAKFADGGLVGRFKQNTGRLLSPSVGGLAIAATAN